jgi:hypothetical protein
MARLMPWQPEPHLVDAITRAGLPAPNPARALELGYTVAEIRAIEADRRRRDAAEAKASS